MLAKSSEKKPYIYNDVRYEVKELDVRLIDTRYKHVESIGVSKFTQRPSFKGEVDSFIKTEEPKKVDKSNNNKFDFSEAVKNFGKGIISPFAALIKHPLMAVGMIAGTVALTTLVPVLAPVLAVGFGAFSVAQIGKGTYDAVKNYKQGNYDDAEKSFDKIGQGVVGTALTALGIKQGAKIAKEAKLMNELKVNTISNAQKESIAMSVDNGGFWSALKENVSLLTTKNGLKSVANQFRPSMIKARALDVFNRIRGNNKVEETREVQRTVEKEVETTEYRIVKQEDFAKTPEGIRRAALTEEQIQQEVQLAFDEVFDRLGVPKDQRPKLTVHNTSAHEGGSYTKNCHELKINSEGYRSGNFEIDEVVMHEATHCKESLLRAGIPQDRVNQIVKEQLLSRIMNGENEEILVGRCLYAETMEPPMMSPKMRAEFAEFAEAELLKPETTSLKSYLYELERKNVDAVSLARAEQKARPLLDRLKAMMDSNPEFAGQYANKEEAMKMLVKYSTSHNHRYNEFIDVKIPVGYSNGERVYLELPELKGEELLKAEQSLIDHIPTTEGNARMQTIRNSLFAGDKDFNQYQFSPEEVLAQKKGHEFFIEKQLAKLAEMRQNGTLNPVEEFRLEALIQRARAIINYKTKGLDYYGQYNKMINNPSDKALADVVKLLEKELAGLKAGTKKVTYIKEPYTVTKIEQEIITELIKVMVDRPMPTTAIPKETIYNMLAILEGNQKAA